MKILFVEDEPVLIDEMLTYFGNQGYLCESAHNYSTALEKVATYNYDIVVLEVNLPGGSGMKLIPSVIERSADTGIVILSIKTSLADKLQGLNLGADDYITKPFHIEELHARLHALYRRKTLKGSHQIVFDNFVIDPNLKALFYKKKEVGLTKKEYQLLIYFIANKERVVSKPAIAEYIWGDNYDQLDNFDAVYVHLMNLRKKLTKASGKDYIKTVYGMGYKFFE
jgi:DNA-binding response OmpR family regulator